MSGASKLGFSDGNRSHLKEGKKLILIRENKFISFIQRFSVIDSFSFFKNLQDIFFRRFFVLFCFLFIFEDK